MHNSSYKTSGLALMLGSLLMVVTMVLHPTGGNFEHILQIATIGMVAHAVAILSVPFSLVGFWGVYTRLQDASFLSRIGLATIIIGLIAAVLAAAINGLALPLFVKHYAGASPQVIESIKPIMRYGSALNHAFDYILIGAVCLSVFCWSLAILVTKHLPKWLGYLGLGLSILAVVMFAAGFYFVDLYGFRWFIFGWVIWVLGMGINLWKNPSSSVT